MKPKPASHVFVIGRKQKPKASREEYEKARLHRFIAAAYVNWQRKMGLIPSETESEGQP